MHDDWFMMYLMTGTLAIAYVAYTVAKRQLTMTRFTRFLGILIICVASSLFPFWILGLMFGFPAALLASILISLFLDKENK